MHLLAQMFAQFFDVQLAQHLQDSLGSHACLEYAGELVAQFAVAALSQKAADAQAFEVVNLRGEIFFQLVSLLVYLECDLVDLGFQDSPGVVRILFFVVRLDRFAQFSKLLIEFFQLCFALGLDPFDAVVELFLKLFYAHCLEFGVHVRDEVLSEVQDPVQVSRGQVQHEAEPARGPLGEPDMGYGRGQGYVSHPFAPYLRSRHLHSAAVADNALVADLLVLSAVALPVLGRAEDALAEKSVLLRSEGAVVDGLGFGHLAVRPYPDLVGRSQGYSNCVEIIAAQGHIYAPSEG